MADVTPQRKDAPNDADVGSASPRAGAGGHGRQFSVARLADMPPPPAGPLHPSIRRRIDGVAVSAQTPCVTSGGLLYVPMGDTVRVFDASGEAMPSLATAGLGGISARTFDAAYDPTTNTLFFGDKNGRSSMLVAVDAETKVVKWAATGACNQVAVLPRQGMVVAISSVADRLHVQRVSDGTPVSSVPVRCPSNLAADALSATIYACTWNPPKDSYSVFAFEWRGSALAPAGRLEAVPESKEGHPLTVVPPAPGKHTAHLVIGHWRKGNLLVVSLPEHKLVLQHELPEGTEVQGLAAAPDGGSLVVMDRKTRAALVLPWPLPGMPPDTRGPPGGGCCAVQ